MIFNELLNTFSQKIAYVRKGPVGVPKSFEVNLATAETDRVFNVSGNMFQVWEAPDEASYVTIKVNESREPGINYSVHTGARTPFDKLLITTPAGQAGNITIIYGTEAPEFLEMIDHRSTTVAGVGGMLDELRGDLLPEGFTGVATGVGVATLLLAANVDRKSCVIQALSTNAGNVFIGYDNTVTVGGVPGIWLAELAPGQAYGCNDYRGDLWGRSTDAQIVGVGEV